MLGGGGGGGGQCDDYSPLDMALCILWVVAYGTQ